MRQVGNGNEPRLSPERTPVGWINIFGSFHFSFLAVRTARTCLAIRRHMAMNFNKGPFGGHHLHGDSCPITSEVVPH